MDGVNRICLSLSLSHLFRRLPQRRPWVIERPARRRRSKGQLEERRQRHRIRRWLGGHRRRGHRTRWWLLLGLGREEEEEGARPQAEDVLQFCVTCRGV